MKRSISVILGCASLLVVSSANAGAQTTQPTQPTQSVQPAPSAQRAQSAPPDKIAIAVNVGYQAQSQDIATNGTYSIYEEDATYAGTQTVGGGVIFDIGAEYRLTRSVGVGVSWSYFSDKGPIAVTAQVPHPLFSNQFRVASAQANDAKHTESVINLDLVYRMPFANKIDLVFYGGPTIASIKHETVSTITVAPETGPSFSNPTINSFTLASQSKTGFGVNVGADAQYMFTPRFGAGAGIRYIYASADITGAADKIKAGGFQVLGGLRARF